MLAAAPDVETSCEALADLLVQHGYALPSVYLLRGGRLRCHAARGYWQVIDGFAPGVGVIGDVLLSGDPVVLPDVSAREDFIAAIPGLRGEAAVPIRFGGEVVGVLSVESLDVLPDSCLDDLTVCADELSRRLGQLDGLPGRTPQEVLADRMVALSTLSCPDAVQAHMIAAARELSGMDTVLVARRDAAGELAVAASAGRLAPALSALSAQDLQVVDGWVEHGTSCYFAGGTASTAHEFFVRAGAGSVLVLPLTVHGARGGVLIVADERVVRCSTDRVQLLEQLAMHGAVTLRSIETVENLRRLALTDALTAAGNSTAFEAYAEEVAAAGTSVALCMVDIDLFKKVNDTYGHVAGDRLLCEVAAVLAGTVGERGRIFRLGGDEFAVVMPVGGRDEAAALGADLCAAARHTTRFTLSVGVTVTSALDKAAIARADGALYEVKRRGRDGYQLGDDGDPADRMSREALQAVPASLAEEIHEVVFTTDACGRLTYLNRAWEELVGVPVADSLGRPLLDWIDRADALAGTAGFRDLWDGRADTLRRQWRWATAPGDTRWFELWARPLRTPAGTVIGTVGTLSDVTARRRAEDALRTHLDLSTIITRVLERFADLDATDVDDGIDDALAQLGRFAGVDRSYLFRFSADQTVVSNTHEWCAEGVSAQIDNLREMPAELLGEWVPRLRGGQAVHVPRVADLPPAQRDLRVSLRAQGIQSLVVVPLLAGRQLIGFLGFDSVAGERVWSDQEIALLRSVANVLVGVVSRRDASEQLTRQALLDGLTGLPNRVSFRACLQQAIDAGSGRAPVALLVIDLDGFKVINHSLGHDAADEVLRSIARRVSATLRNPDVVARLGGDQLAVLCSDLESADAGVQIAQRIAETVREPMTVDDVELYVTASIGVAFLDGASGASAVLADADTALRCAKRRGRDRVEVFTEALRANVSQRLEIAADLRRAINDGDLRLVYQPIVDLATGTVTAAEALVRWDHPHRGPVPPLELVSVAEETGLILGLGRWVLLHACRQLARWQAAGVELSVSVNLSAQQLGDDGLLDTVAEATTRAGVAPAALTLELTESTLMTDTAQALSVLRALTDFGARLSIDDFGTGFSSLSYLKRFPVHELKIDRTFVRGLGSDAEDAAIVAAIHSLARALSLRVVAEGVERAAQRAALLELGCDRAQGHWFSPAVDGARLLSAISAL